MLCTLDQACEQLHIGGVVGMPTETVYGLAADATRDEAVVEVYTYKQRPRFHPLISHVSSIEMACELGECDANLLEDIWLRRQWSLTVIVRRRATSPLSWLTTAGLETVAIRYPQHQIAQQLIQQFGKPLAAPSANMFGGLSPVCAEHVHKAWPHVMVVDGGPCRRGVESTIVDLTSSHPVWLRLGATSRDDLLHIWPNLAAASQSATAAPGTLPQHYRPRTPLKMNQTQAEPGGALVGFGNMVCDVNLSRSGCVVEAAANLFHMLHSLDEGQYTSIAVVPIPNSGLGEAINDRLARATYAG